MEEESVEFLDGEYLLMVEKGGDAFRSLLVGRVWVGRARQRARLQCMSIVVKGLVSCQTRLLRDYRFAFVATKHLPLLACEILYQAECLPSRTRPVCRVSVLDSVTTV